jgi:hypothetical protein
MAEPTKKYLTISPANRYMWSAGCEDGRADRGLANPEARRWLANALRARVESHNEKTTNLVTADGLIAQASAYEVKIEDPGADAPSDKIRFTAAAAIRACIVRGWLSIDLDGPVHLVNAAREILAQNGPDIAQDLKIKDDRPEQSLDAPLATRRRSGLDAPDDGWRPSWAKNSKARSSMDDAPPSAPTDAITGRRAALHRSRLLGSIGAQWWIDRRRPFWEAYDERGNLRDDTRPSLPHSGGQADKPSDRRAPLPNPGSGSSLTPKEAFEKLKMGFPACSAEQDKVQRHIYEIEARKAALAELRSMGSGSLLPTSGPTN